MADPFDKVFRGDGYAVFPFRSAVPRERIRALILSVFEAVTRANGIPGVADDRAVIASATSSFVCTPAASSN